MQRFRALVLLTALVAAAVIDTATTAIATSSPVVDIVNPNHGSAAGGTAVQIVGSGFSGATQVSFGANPIPPCAPGVFVNCFGSPPGSDTLIFTNSAPGTANTTVDVKVTVGATTSASNSFDRFTYDVAGPPVVSGLSPRSGTANGGTAVTIFGSGFIGATQVAFGTATVPPCGPGLFGACFGVNGDNGIFANSPPGSAGSVDVTVKVGIVISATGSADKFTYLAPGTPVVDAVVPGHGTAAGGTNVQILGSGFGGATQLAFGAATMSPCTPGVFGSCFQINGDGAINTSSPAGTAGMTVDVKVTAAGLISATNPFARFTYDAAGSPIVSGVSPRTGSATGGTMVQILGTGFSGATAVKFGTVTLVPCGPGVFVACFMPPAGDTFINATSPPGTLGPVDVTVTTAAGTSLVGNADKFTYLAAGLPMLDAVIPNHGSIAGGTGVQIIGSGFTGATAVLFGSTSVPPCPSTVGTCFNLMGDNAIGTNTPPGTVGPADVRVTTAAGTSTVNPFDTFTYDALGSPVVSGVTPRSGPAAGGTTVLILGSGFTGASFVFFGSLALPPCGSLPCFTLNGDGAISAPSPPGPVGSPTVDVTVTTPIGTSATGASDLFNYTGSPLSSPIVDAVIPGHGTAAGGTPLQIYGKGFTGATQVAFGTSILVPCGPGVFGACFNTPPGSDTVIFTSSPPGAVGPVDVTVKVGTVTSTPSLFDRFTYDPAGPPVVSGVSPRSGPATGGTAVQIIGSGFAGATQVAFGTTTEPPCGPGVFGPCFNMPSGGDNMIFATSPPGTSGPPVDVTVKVGAVTSATGTADKFGYAAPTSPLVDAVVPGHGTAAGGTNVQIVGSGFTGATQVAFGTAALPPCGPGFSGACFNVNGDNTINTNSPPGTADATVDVMVTAAGRAVRAANPYDKFTYDAIGSPIVSGVSPRTGSATGGTGVQILGSGLTGASAVTFGTSTPLGPCSPSVFGPCFHVNGDGMIFATSPSGTVGAVDVKVTTGAGTSPTDPADAFNYVAASAPLVDVVFPGHGTAAGGTSLTIHGSGFTGATGVVFGTVTLVPCSPTVFASCFNINGDNAIFTNTPPGLVGPVDVRVTTGAGTSAINAFDTYSYDPLGPPVVIGVSPRTGPAAGGTGVLILGSGFTGATAVKFGTTALPMCPAAGARCFNLFGDGRITATSPSEAGGMTVDVTVTVGETTSATGIADNFTYAPTPLPPPAPGLKQLYHPLSPARILDTRDGTGGVPAAPLGPASSLAIQIAGRGGVPTTGVSAVVLNVTVTDTSTASYLVMYASGSTLPVTSNLNWTAGQTVANLVEVPVGPDGRLSAFNALGSTDVVIDVAGYVSTPEAGPAGQYNPLVPARLLDTRTGVGGGTTLGAGVISSLQVTGRGGVPAGGVSAVVLNLTATNATKSSYLTAWPDGTAQPLASNVNFVAGQTVPNRAIVKVGPTGKIDLFNAFGSVDLVVDVGGYFTDATPGGTGSGFNPLTSARLLDTRDGTGGVTARVGPGGTLAVQVAGLNGIPAMTSSTPPKAVVLNVTVTNPTSPSYLVLWPDGSAQPLASDLNYGTGKTVANLVVVALGADGKVDLVNAAGSTDVVIDVVGWYG